MLVSWTPPSMYGVTAYAAVCVYAFYAWTSDALHPRRYRWFLAVLLSGLIVYSYKPFHVDSEAHVTILDVGQGDCIQWQVIVVDDSGIPSHPQQLWQKRLDPYDVGVQYLRYRGIHKIDYLILLQIRDFRVLITGDIEKEADIAGRWHFPSVDVLKVAHHGSRTSTGETWMALVRPAAAVISVGTTGTVIHQRELIHRCGRNVVVGGGTVTF
jgi:beta-lactamase superfamily II metal-dependent hydrolase